MLLFMSSQRRMTFHLVAFAITTLIRDVHVYPFYVIGETRLVLESFWALFTLEGFLFGVSSQVNSKIRILNIGFATMRTIIFPIYMCFNVPSQSFLVLKLFSTDITFEISSFAVNC